MKDKFEIPSLIKAKKRKKKKFKKKKFLNFFIRKIPHAAETVLALLLILPITGFWLGMKYQMLISNKPAPVVQTTLHIIPTKSQGDILSKTENKYIQAVLQNNYGTIYDMLLPAEKFQMTKDDYIDFSIKATQSAAKVFDMKIESIKENGDQATIAVRSMRSIDGKIIPVEEKDLYRKLNNIWYIYFNHSRQ